MDGDFRGIGMTSQRSRDRLVDQLREMGIRSELVLDIIKNIPRHIFVDEALSSRAYDNTALPIGFSQTISQPYIVACMTEVLLANGPLDTVLEIGTGCGYQTAVLSRIAKKVYSIERIEALLARARRTFRALQCRNIFTRHGDGNFGWAERAPFNGILVAAAPLGVPKALLDQLAPGGRLVIPVGKSGEQELRSIVRGPEGFEERRIDSVSFVPMVEGKG